MWKIIESSCICCLLRLPCEDKSMKNSDQLFSYEWKKSEFSDSIDDQLFWTKSTKYWESLFSIFWNLWFPKVLMQGKLSNLQIRNYWLTICRNKSSFRVISLWISRLDFFSSAFWLFGQSNLIWLEENRHYNWKAADWGLAGRNSVGGHEQKKVSSRRRIFTVTSFGSFSLSLHFGLFCLSSYLC